MKINSLHLKNFRCFENFDINFNDRLTVIVGTNGAGKSTVLDAASVAIGSFLAGIDGMPTNSISIDDVRHNAYRIGSTIDLQPQFPAIIKAEGSLRSQSIEWERALNKSGGKTTTKEAKEIIDIAAALQKSVRTGDLDTVLPLISYYGTGRLWAQKKQKRDTESVQQFSRMSGYVDCLDIMSNDKLMLKWFEKMTLLEVQNKKPLPELLAAKKALVDFYSRMTKHTDIEIQYSFDSAGLEVQYTDFEGKRQKAPLKELSDGYKNTLSMIADIAYRMAVLNPQFLDSAISLTPGIVLIDEVDLHLHPTWQQHVLHDLMEIFPLIQFIVTTHAPAVIQSISNEKLVVLDDYIAYYPSTSTYGRDVNSILKEIMGATARTEDVQKQFDELYDKVSSGEIDAAEQMLNKLETVIGRDDAELQGARVTIELESLGE